MLIQVNLDGEEEGGGGEHLQGDGAGGKIVRIPSNHFYFLHLITGCCVAGKGVGKPEAFW